MKAPKKIYLRKRNKLPSEVVRDKWYETDPQNRYGSVEYTRTDAFIEKACQWIKDNHEDIYIRYLRGCSSDDEILLFKEYMEGE